MSMGTIKVVLNSKIRKKGEALHKENHTYTLAGGFHIKVVAIVRY